MRCCVSRERKLLSKAKSVVEVVEVKGITSSSVIPLSRDVHRDAGTESGLAARMVSKQDLANLARRLQIVLADDLDAKRPEHRAVARDAAELPESAGLVAGLLGPDLQVDLLAVESRLRLVDSTTTDGVAVVGALLVVSEVDDGHHGAVRQDVCLDEVVGEGVGAVLAALVDQALLAVDLRRGLLRGELLGGGEALGVGASDLGEEGESGGVLLGGLVGPQLAQLLDVLLAHSTVGLEGIPVGTECLAEGRPADGGDGRPGIEGRDGQIDSRADEERVVNQCDGSSISWDGGDGESEWGGSDGRLLCRGDALGHPGGLQDRVGDPAAVDKHTVLLDDIVGEAVGAVVVLVGTHGRDWLGGGGMCLGRVCEWDE